MTVVNEQEALAPPIPLMTIDEVAAWFGCSRNTCRRLISAGELPVIRVGHQLRFDRAQIAEWIRTQQVEFS